MDDILVFLQTNWHWFVIGIVAILILVKFFPRYKIAPPDTALIISRLIRRTTGKNYTELLQEKRLSQAAWLLRNTDRRVDEIARVVGYENVSYFHRLFAARFGCTPKKYRDCK